MKNSIALGLLLLSPCAFANVEYLGELSYAHSDNLTNAIRAKDIYSDQLLNGKLAVNKLWVPAVGKSIILGGNLGVNKFSESKGLNNTTLGASLSYIQRMGLGAYAPRLSFSVSGDYRNFNSDLRDGELYRASVMLEKRLSPAWHASAMLTHEQRLADTNKASPYNALVASGDVFNQENQELRTNLDYAFENSSLLTASYTFRDGEVDASTNPASSFFPFSKAIAHDSEVCKSCQAYVAYLVDARIHSLELDWNWPLTQDSSVSFIFNRRVAHAAGNNTYTNSIFRLQLNQRF